MELKDKIAEKAREQVECIQKIGKQDYFELNIKHINGEIFTQTSFTDKDKYTKKK